MKKFVTQKEILTIYLVLDSNWWNRSFIFCIFRFDLGGFFFVIHPCLMGENIPD